jgi:hypothetical protein
MGFAHQVLQAAQDCIGRLFGGLSHRQILTVAVDAIASAADLMHLTVSPRGPAVPGEMTMMPVNSIRLAGET